MKIPNEVIISLIASASVFLLFTLGRLLRRRKFDKPGLQLPPFEAWAKDIAIETTKPAPVFFIESFAGLGGMLNYTNTTQTGDRAFDRQHTLIFAEPQLALQVITPDITGLLKQLKYINIESTGKEIYFYLSPLITNATAQEVFYAVQSVYHLLAARIAGLKETAFTPFSLELAAKLKETKTSFTEKLITAFIVLLIVLGVGAALYNADFNIFNLLK